MKTNIYLARHGQTQWNQVHRFQGQLDSELTAVGKRQSAQIAQQLSGENIDLIFSSPLGRAVASAKICQQVLNAPLISSNALTERHLGQWQGQHVDDIKHEKNYHEILHQFTNLAPVGGESAIECGERIYTALELLVENNSDKNLLIILHGEALRCFLARTGENLTNNAYQLFTNGCVIALTYDHQTANFQLIRKP